MITLKELSRSEAKRYLGGSKIELDEKMNELFESCEKQVISTAKPAYLYKVIDLPNDELFIGNDVKNHLNGCEKAVLICATLGAGVDALLRTCGHRSAADLVMAQAVSTALVETYCDECEQKMLQEPAVCGETLRMRFSPGYGDLPLETQRPLLAALDAARRAGITLSETMLMMPSKSVSAIIGVGPGAGRTAPRDCRRCGKADCAFRAEGDL